MQHPSASVSNGAGLALEGGGRRWNATNQQKESQSKIKHLRVKINVSINVRNRNIRRQGSSSGGDIMTLSSMVKWPLTSRWYRDTYLGAKVSLFCFDLQGGQWKAIDNNVVGKKRLQMMKSDRYKQHHVTEFQFCQATKTSYKPVISATSKSFKGYTLCVPIIIMNTPVWMALLSGPQCYQHLLHNIKSEY